jgi:hypothetical protein
MKSITGYLVGAVVLALLGTACLMLAFVDRDLARAEQSVATQHYDQAEAAYRKAEGYFELASHIPGVGRGPVNTIRARSAALRYWQRDFSSIIPKQNDPVTAVPSDNIELQIVTANAVYRAAETRVKDRPTALQALDAGINGYVTVLKNAKRNEEAAYNFEYLVRLRDDVDKGRRKDKTLPMMITGNGTLGFPAPELEDTRTFKVLVPLDNEERDKMGNAGKMEPKARKG